VAEKEHRDGMRMVKGKKGKGETLYLTECGKTGGIIQHKKKEEEKNLSTHMIVKRKNEASGEGCKP